jgi:tRNA (cytidine/uridine-2'-O-)-methyltransferase
VREHAAWEGYLAAKRPRRVLAFSMEGERSYADVAYMPADTVPFGPETRGLPEELLGAPGRDNLLRVPMVPGSRSLNLSNAVAVLVCEGGSAAGWPPVGVDSRATATLD